MKAPDVILMLVQEAGVDYRCLQTFGFDTCSIEIASTKCPEFYSLKIICGFENFSDPTLIIIHICDSFECCVNSWTMFPIEHNTTYGTLEDPKFYEELVRLINSMK